MGRYLRSLFTLAHLRPAQGAWLVARRVLKVGAGEVAAPEVSLRGVTARTGFLAPESDQDFSRGVTFLNQSRDFPTGVVDWESADMPKLWRYNLHYFDFLHWPRVADGRRAQLMDHWLAANPQGAEDAWEPYTVSLRIVNWVKLFLQPQWRGRLEDRWLDSLAAQAAWLMQNLEHHILANHLLKNAKALFFAGAFFTGPAADRWLARGLELLRREAREQFLADGAHYELSPMYHQLCSEDYLDVLNLALGTDTLAADDDVALFRDTCERALAFSLGTALPDGDIPLFNDSAFGIAPPPPRLAAYAEGVLGAAPPGPGEGLIEFPQAGYYGVRDGGVMWLVDCGPVSPAYQPGHTHCDMLSFELAVGGRRVIVDSGVHDYGDTQTRHYARSTRAHNTVAVDGVEQSELWGVFRVARRARPLRAVLRQEGGEVFFLGEISGFPGAGRAVSHRREIRYRPGEGMDIRDTVTGASGRAVNALLHLHPDLEAHRQGSRVTVADAGGGAVLEIAAGAGVELALDTAWYFPEFGVKRQNRVVVLRSPGNDPAEMAYTLRFGG